MNNKYIAGAFIAVFLIAIFSLIPLLSNERPEFIKIKETQSNKAVNFPTATVIPTQPVATPPASYVIPSASHVGQSFNNCGPASLSMILSYFGTNVSQEELRLEMRPFSNPAGGVDDKSIFAPEFVEHAKRYGYESLERPNGTNEMLKALIANDIPVVLRTWLHPNEDIGHFRIVRGFDDERGVYIQDDSYEGRNLEYDYATFEEMWKPFNYGYILVYPEDKKEVVESIIGDNIDRTKAYEYAVSRAEVNLQNNPESAYDLFNLSTSYYHVGDFQKSVEYYEKAQSKTLPPRMMWYQIEPLRAYLEVGDHERVFALTDWIISNNNIAFSEMYILRGKAYYAQGNIEAARDEFEKAVYYNNKSTEAKEALNSL